MQLKNRGVLRTKYLAYTPEDVLEIDSRDTLEKLYELHTPSGQPQTWAEILYLKVMSDLIREN